MTSKRSKVIKSLSSPSPSKRPRTSNQSSPMSCSSSSSSHQTTPNHPSKRARVSPMPSTSSESSQAHLSPRSTAVETVSDSASPHQGGYDILKLLKALVSFRLRSGILPTKARGMPEFLKEVKDFVPKGLSEKQLFYKLEYLRLKFRRNRSPGPNCTDFQRSSYELGLKIWGSRPLRAIGNASDSVNRNGKSEESENEEEEDAQWETEDRMELGIDDEDEPLENGCVNLPEQDEADSPYKYLKHALEDFWIAKNLNLNILQLALQKVDSVQANYLDEQFMKIAKDELRLKVEKNRLSNDIINVLCTPMK